MTSPIICSRCGVVRSVPTTDSNPEDISLFKTCTSCRNKLKAYRKTHVNCKKEIQRDTLHKSDDTTPAEVPFSPDVKKRRKFTKPLPFDSLLRKIYTSCKTTDLHIDDVYALEQWTLPHLSMSELDPLLASDEEDATSAVTVNVSAAVGAGPGERASDAAELESSGLLAAQAVKDVRFKSALIEALDVHYLSRVRHVLKCFGIEFRFYVSSWKNGRYYTTFKCVDDRTALKRFGIEIGVTQEILEPDPPLTYKESVMKSKLQSWLNPTENAQVDENLDIENEQVNSHFQTLIGFHCHSKLNCIVDYAKMEMRVKFDHKYHRAELKHEEDTEPEKEHVKKKPVPRRASVIETASSIQRPKLSDKLDELYKKLEF